MDLMLGEISDVMKNKQHANDHQKMQEILVQCGEKHSNALFRFLSCLIFMMRVI